MSDSSSASSSCASNLQLKPTSVFLGCCLVESKRRVGACIDGQCWISIFDIANSENHSLRLANGLGRSNSSSSNSPSSWSRRSNVARSSYSSWTSRCRVAMTGSASRPNRTEKEIRFAERKILPDGFGSTSTRPGRNLTRTFPKTEPKFGLQNLPLVRQECERQKCERHQCEANSANANSAKGSTVRMRQECECQMCECQQCDATSVRKKCDSSANDNSAKRALCPDMH